MSDEPFGYLRIEVTFAAAIITPENKLVGDNMADLTLAFGWRVADDVTHPGITDEVAMEVLRKAVGPVTGLMTAQMTLNGWVAMGQVDDPMAGWDGNVPGKTVRTDPQRVRVVPMGPEGRA
jgi:hypothetical protein